MYKMVDHILCIYGHFVQDFPSSFYGQHPLLCRGRFDIFFIFQGSRVIFLNWTPRISAIDCCVYWHKLLLNACCCQRSGVISCVANFQLKRMNSFLRFFEVLCCSILTMLQRLREQYRRCIKMQKQSTQIILARPSLSPNFDQRCHYLF